VDFGLEVIVDLRPFTADRSRQKSHHFTICIERMPKGRLPGIEQGKTNDSCDLESSTNGGTGVTTLDPMQEPTRDARTNRNISGRHSFFDPGFTEELA
jgi:hypothetical protein